jgi:hypothetical protein
MTPAQSTALRWFPTAFNHANLEIYNGFVDVELAPHVLSFIFSSAIARS